MFKWIRENKIVLIMMLIFEVVAVSLFLSTKKIFYLLNFNYIGICIWELYVEKICRLKVFGIICF